MKLSHAGVRVLPLHSLGAGTPRGAFTLVELILVVLLATCLIGLYIRALDDADTFARSLREGRVLTIEQKVVIRQGLLREAAEGAPHEDPAHEEPDLANDGERGAAVRDVAH